MDFNKSIFENRTTKGTPFLVAHRGVCGANIPCNTLESFEIALKQGADVIELDVTKSKDGEFFVFHPGKEFAFLNIHKSLSNMTSNQIKKLTLLNQDRNHTSYKIPTLKETLEFLKDKVYINIDKFWTDPEGITRIVKEAKVEKQVIIKTFVDSKSLNIVVKFAPDLMFMPIVTKKDDVGKFVGKVNIIGAEILFSSENDMVISDNFIKSMHAKKLLVWANSIVYDEKAVISAFHTDDKSLTNSPDDGWGWLVDKNVDFIQTDWLLPLKLYIENRQKF